MIITVFRQHTDPAVLAEYGDLAGDVYAAAGEIEGFVGAKKFTAPDGEACTIVEFRDLEAHNRWIAHPLHRHAMHRGREAFFETYRIVVAEAIRVLQSEPEVHVTVPGEAEALQPLDDDPAHQVDAADDRTVETSHFDIDTPFQAADVVASDGVTGPDGVVYRELRIAPGGVVPMADYSAREGRKAHLVSGKLTEFASTEPRPRLREAPVTVDLTGRHWWRNDADEPAVLLLPSDG